MSQVCRWLQAQQLWGLAFGTLQGAARTGGLTPPLGGPDMSSLPVATMTASVGAALPAALKSPA